jgi:hypothetical protein
MSRSGHSPAGAKIQHTRHLYGYVHETCKVQSATDGTLNGTLNSTEQMVFDCIKATPGVSANALIQQTEKTSEPSEEQSSN